jgi:hypothetical protein
MLTPTDEELAEIEGRWERNHRDAETVVRCCMVVPRLFAALRARQAEVAVLTAKLESAERHRCPR